MAGYTQTPHRSAPCRTASSAIWRIHAPRPLPTWLVSASSSGRLYGRALQGAQLDASGRLEARHAEAIADITDYIVGFYNCKRINSALGYPPPTVYERKMAALEPIVVSEIT